MSETEKYRVVIELTEHQAKNVLKHSNPEIFEGEVILLRRIDDTTKSILMKIGADLLRYSIRVDDK